MTLNPTLKSILVRTAYIVGSLTIYYIAYNYCLDYLDFHYWSDGGLIDGHPTLRYTLLMMAAAILIWVNIRKLSRPNIRLYFSAFLLGLGLLIGAWKVGAFYLYSEHVLLQAKFAIIDCNCVGKKRFLLDQLLNYRIVLRR